tara:strand:- start:1469 stop:2581 length:1113 start_codon:yes stop_codon:yes gene_type:complete
MDSKNITRECESFLASFFKKKKCILTGNGTVSLAICYSFMPHNKTKVILPSVVCPNLVYALTYASKKAVYADVLLSNATIDPDCVRTLLENDNDNEIGAIVAVHLYGHQAQINKLRSIADEYNVLLIEDICQSMGGHSRDGQLLGVVGDCTVMSFGRTKIIDVQEGGGVLVNSNKLENKARKFINLLPDQLSLNKRERLSKVYRELFYSVWNGGSCNDGFYQIFDQFPSLFKGMYLTLFNNNIAKNILAEFKELDKNISHRQAIYNIYKKMLSDVDQIILFDSTSSEAPWRFSFRVNARHRDILVEKIRKSGFNASIWYPCIAAWSTHDKTLFKSGRLIEAGVINLWVDAECSISSAKDTAKLICKYFDK